MERNASLHAGILWVVRHREEKMAERSYMMSTALSGNEKNESPSKNVLQRKHDCSLTGKNEATYGIAQHRYNITIFNEPDILTTMQMSISMQILLEGRFTTYLFPINF